MNFETTFQFYINVLKKHEKQLKEKASLDLGQYRDIQKSIVNDKENSVISYTFNHIRFIVPKKLRPSHCIPRSISHVELTLSMKSVIAFKVNSTKVEDPFFELETLNLTLKNQEFTSSWHLDRHTEKGIPNSYHPFYHFTFGGKYMEQLDVSEENKFGHALILRTPRIAHPPMEVVLGTDFILRNYFPFDELDILSDPNYNRIVDSLKNIFWKPYAMSIAKYYCNNMTIDGKQLEFNDVFANSINGIYS
jgi:hypothetical protein